MKIKNDIQTRKFFRRAFMIGCVFLFTFFLLTISFAQDIKIIKPPIQKTDQIKLLTPWAYARALNSVVYVGEAINPELAEFRVTSVMVPIGIAQTNKVEMALGYYIFYRPKTAQTNPNKYWTMDGFSTPQAALDFINRQGQYANKPPKEFRIAGVTNAQGNFVQFLVLYAEVPGQTVPNDWRYKSFNTAQEVQNFLNQKSPLGDYVTGDAEVTTAGGKFHVFYRTTKIIPMGQQWKFVKRATPEEVVQFLNTGAAGGHEIETARIGGMKEPLQTFFYVFYK